MIGELIQLYAAIWLVILLHELGHIPEKIKFGKGIIPKAAAMNAKSRMGGLIMNIILFSVIFYMKPEALFLRLLGLVAWAHFIFYAVLGSIIPEKNPKNVNTDTYVFDDVPNELWYIFIPLAIFSFIYFKEYYIPIIGGLF
jgi:hypothetical protein